MNRCSSGAASLIVIAGAGLLSGCATSIVSDGLARITPYRVEIVQGNVITREQMESVKTGMNREQVRNVLGAPLLSDVFHADRWDYVFTLRRKGLEPQRRSVVAWFEGDVLKKLDAPTDLPSEIEFVAGLGKPVTTGNVPKLELTEAERRALPTPAQPDVAAPPRTTAPRTYPPLEPAT